MIWVKVELLLISTSLHYSRFHSTLQTLGQTNCQLGPREKNTNVSADGATEHVLINRLVDLSDSFM